MCTCCDRSKKGINYLERFLLFNLPYRKHYNKQAQKFQPLNLIKSLGNETRDPSPKPNIMFRRVFPGAGFQRISKNFNCKLSTFASNLSNAPFFQSTSLTRSKLLAEGNGGKRIVGYWLAGTSAAVFGIIVFGGLTRLTESGLSMVDWKLIHFQAPKNDQEWEAYFEKYKEFPEYKM